MKKSSAWVQAFRLHTLPLAIAGILLGNCVAYRRGNINIIVFILSAFTALFLQTLSNLSNDYGDFKHGADTAQRIGPVRFAQHGLISMKAIKTAIGIFAFLSLVIGLAILFLSEKTIGAKGALMLFVIGIFAIIAAVAYTATKKPYGYHALGDISVFAFFGIVSVIGSYYLQRGHIEGDIFLPAAAMGLLSAAVLNINNLRDLETDRLAGKKTIANLLGEKSARLYHACLLLSAIMLFVIFSWINLPPRYLWFLAPAILFIVNIFAISKSKTPQSILPLLKQLSVFILLFTMTYCIGLVLSR